MAGGALTSSEEGVLIAVWVVAGASRASIDGLHGERVKIRVTSPPQQGRANDEVSRMLADVLGCEVVLESGIRSRAKTFHVSISDVGVVREKLGL